MIMKQLNHINKSVAQPLIPKPESLSSTSSKKTDNVRKN